MFTVASMCVFVILQNLRVLKYVGDEKKVEWGKHWIEQGFNGKSDHLFIYGKINAQELSCSLLYYNNCEQVVILVVDQPWSCTAVLG